MQGVFQVMAIPPWGFLGWVNPTLGVVGLSVQILGVIGLLFILFTGRF